MTLEDVNKRRSSLLRISIPTNDTEAKGFDFDLDIKEYGVVGYALIHWSFLEHALLETTIALAAILEVDVPTDARQDSFRRRLAAFRESVQQIDDADIQTQFLKLADRIANANGFRQKLTHGIWSYKSADPDILHVAVSRHKGDGPEEFLNVTKIAEFAQRVGEMSFELLHPDGLTVEDFVEQMLQDGGYISRTALREMLRRD